MGRARGLRWVLAALSVALAVVLLSAGNIVAGIGRRTRGYASGASTLTITT